MKRFCYGLGLLGVIPLLASCASSSLTLAPVGPHPGGGEYVAEAAGMGQLEVFTATDEYEYDKDVPFFPHRDYHIYTADGKHLERVWNHQNHEDESPTLVSLPAGQYVVKADAQSFGLVTVPVVIRPHQLTRVVLQPGWKPGPAVASADLVQFPGGYAIGWRAEPSGQQEVSTP